MTPANPDFMRLDWLIGRLTANRLTGRERVRFTTTGRDALVVMSIYPAPEGADLWIDLGPKGSE